MSDLQRLNASALTRVHLIRHGESVANRDGLVCGCLDFELSDRGRSQALSMSRTASIQAIRQLPCITSELSRAVETAQLLGMRPTLNLHYLKETDTGALSHLRQSDLSITHPQFKHHWTDLDSRYEAGETTREMLQRSWSAFVSVATQNSWREVVVVAHGGPLNSICSHLLQVSFDGFPRFLFENVLITTLSRDDVKSCFWRLERMNAT